MPFNYTPYRSPFTNSIAETMLRKGDAAARAAEQTGQIYGQAIQNIGQTVNGTIQQAMDPRRKLEQQAVAQGQAMQAGQQRLDQLVKPYTPNGPQPEGEGPAPTQHPYLDENGLYDIPKLTQALSESGMAHLAPDLLKGAEQINDSILKHQELQQKTAQAATLMYGDMADGIMKMTKAGVPFAQALDMAAAPGLATKRFDPQQFAQLKVKLLSLPPEQQQAALGTLMDQAAQISPEKDLSEGAQRRDRYNRLTATNAKTEKPTEASLAADAATFGTPTQTPTAAASKAALESLQKPTLDARAEQARHDKELERISGLTAGREAAAQAETARHNRAMEQAANPFGAGSGTGGAQGPTGDEFLKGLAPGVAAQVKALAEGRQPFPTGMSYAKLQPLIQLVTQYDPTFDAANYTARSKARADLTSPNGTGGKTINSLNTAVQHLGKLSDLIEALDNGDTPALNAVANWFSKATGSPKVTNFEAVQPQAMKEIERLWRGAGGSEGDINALKASLSTNMGRQQQREALNQFVELVKGKLDSTEQQRDNILGPAAQGVPVLFEQNKPILAKIAQRAGGQTAASGGGPKEGEVKPIEGHPGTEQTYRNGKWIRTK